MPGFGPAGTPGNLDAGSDLVFVFSNVADPGADVRNSVRSLGGSLANISSGNMDRAFRLQALLPPALQTTI